MLFPTLGSVGMSPRRYILLNGQQRALQAVAFDLDSTLTRPYLDFKKLRRQLDLPEGDILQWLDQLPSQAKSQAQAIIEAFEQDGVENVEWNDGAQETLQAVRAMGLSLVTACGMRPVTYFGRCLGRSRGCSA